MLIEFQYETAQPSIQIRRTAHIPADYGNHYYTFSLYKLLSHILDVYSYFKKDLNNWLG